jgi:AraC family transcriptional regulator of adaptative response/methylated-DNA-[protein]-cysteine methyltransferase
MIKTTVIETPIGDMKAGATKEGLCFLAFNDTIKADSELADLARILNTEVTKGSNRHLRSMKRQLKEYFKGKRKDFSLSLVTPGSDFQMQVWKGLKEIPYGSTISYHRQAEKLNNPGAIRAVAHANGSNRIAIIIPCHRVIGADGNLTGYGGGLERKQWLIDHEKKFSGKPVDGTLF